MWVGSYCLGAVVLTCSRQLPAQRLSLTQHSSALEPAYLECDRVGVRVLETEGLRHLLLEGACHAQYGCTEMRAGVAHA